MNTVLIISPHFPPSTLAGVHRARHLGKHLPTYGWRPIVIRAHESCYTEPGDPELAKLVPADLEQRRTGALSAAAMRCFGVGDIGIRAFFHMRTAIDYSVRKNKPKLVLITGSPYYPMLLSGWISRQLGLPVILDFQDPWVSEYGATLPKRSKGGLSHRLAVALEPRAVRHASFITSVSETQNAQMAARYSWLDRSRMAAIPIGGDPEDFDALRSQRAVSVQTVIDRSRINLSYVGTMLPRSTPLVRSVFHAVQRLRVLHPQVASRLRVNFVGTSNQPDYLGPGLVTKLASEAGVQDLVTEIPRRVPFLDALYILANSSGLLLIGSDEPHYTASKIYPALMSGRAYVSLFHTASSSHRILTAAGGGKTFSFSDLAELEALEPVMAAALAKLATEPQSFARADSSIYEKYTASSVARHFAQVFEQLTS